MRKNKYYILLNILIMISVVTITYGQQSTTHLNDNGCVNGWEINNEGTFINLPSAPLQMGLSKNKGNIEIENISSKNIISYKCGFYIKTDKEYKIIPCTSIIEEKLEIKGSDLRSYQIQELVKSAKQMNAKLTIIEVYFDDDTVWTGSLIQ